MGAWAQPMNNKGNSPTDNSMGAWAPMTASPFNPEQQATLIQAGEVIQEYTRANEILDDPCRWGVVVRAVRIIREHALRETGANNTGSPLYKRKFRELMEQQTFGLWLLEDKRNLDGCHWLAEDNRLEHFIEWCDALNQDQRQKWKRIRSLCKNFRVHIEGPPAPRDPRSKPERDFDAMQERSSRTVEAAHIERDEARQELATRTVKSKDTFRVILEAGIAKFGADAVRAMFDDLTMTNGAKKDMSLSEYTFY
jgi:hypothetical protein